jgi:tetratricopeptide (TPR) repeat protein
MINLLIALAAGALAAVLIHASHVFGSSWAIGIAPGTLVTAGVYVLLARRVATKVQKLAEQAQAALQGVRTEKDRIPSLDKAIKIFESARSFSRWQFFIGSEISANIGILQYMKRDYGNAKPHLEKALSRNWMAKTYLGCIEFQAKDDGAMKTAFEAAVTGAGKKEGLAWAAYAWCLENLKQHDAAIAVASRATTENPADEKLKRLQNQLQNNKRLKMNGFEPMWWQFALEKPPNEMTQPRVRFQRGRRF